MAISFVGAASGVGSIALPTHQKNDLLVVGVANPSSATFGLPSYLGWSVGNAIGVTSPDRNVAVIWKIAESNSESLSVPAGILIVAAGYRDTDYLLTVGGQANGGGNDQTVANYSRLRFVTHSNHTAKFRTPSGFAVAVAFTTSMSADITTSPSGMTNRTIVNNGTYQLSLHDTNAEISSWTGATVALGTTAGCNVINSPVEPYFPIPLSSGIYNPFQQQRIR